MESAGSLCEKKDSFGFTWTIVRPSPAFARNTSASNPIILVSLIAFAPSLSTLLGNGIGDTVQSIHDPASLR